MIVTTVYGRVNEDGSVAENGEDWWNDFDQGVYAGAFCCRQEEDAEGNLQPGIYEVMFAPGTFDRQPALVVTAEEGNRSLRSCTISNWEPKQTTVETTNGDQTVSAWMVTIGFKNRQGLPLDTGFSFVATGLLGEALPQPINVVWKEATMDSTASLQVLPIDCDHPMTLEWVPVDDNGDPTTSFYITAILGLPSNVFGIPQGEQRTSNVDTALLWKAFNNCPEAGSAPGSETPYQYTICAVKGNQVACKDPKIRNIAQ